GIAEIEALLQGLQRDYLVNTYPGVDLAANHQEEERLMIEPGVTELMLAAGLDLEDQILTSARRLGITVYSVREFLSALLDGERILRVSTQDQPLDGLPWLGQILKQAGFEPSCLYSQAGVMRFEPGRGIHWVLPDRWLSDMLEENAAGREPRQIFARVYWVENAQSLDFYGLEDQRRQYIGSLNQPDQGAWASGCLSAIQTALTIGVSWQDIQDYVQQITRTETIPRSDRLTGIETGEDRQNICEEAIDELGGLNNVVEVA
ncbi:MAG: hypothetical protein LBT32_03960, partial [Peptococcaceae bacterium]|nr:hypothetical protein [Peptococcaceae bacterium]